MPAPDPQQEKTDEVIAKLAAAARSFGARAKSQAAIDLEALIDPDGDSVAGLVDAEKTPGAAALAVPLDLLTFETWVLGHLGDRDELELDINTHREAWFSLGAWIGETLRRRHGGFWMLVTDDPRAWRLAFTKILLEIAPHAFAEKLLRSGEGFARKMVSEMERIRLGHEEQAQAEGGIAAEKYAFQHYARMHTVPLAQWLVLDGERLRQVWTEVPVGALKARIVEEGAKLGPQNAPAIEQVVTRLSKLDAEKPAAQIQDRGLFEAIAQLLGLKRATPPLAVDVLEKLVLPALHIGIPASIPPLGEDDVQNIKNGADLFAVWVDVVPYVHQAHEGGFLGAFDPKELATPYPDRTNLDVGKGDWLVVNPQRLVTLFERFDPKKMLAAYQGFIAHVAKLPGVPRIRNEGSLAENVARAASDLRACLGSLDSKSMLVFRLLPPPA